MMYSQSVQSTWPPPTRTYDYPNFNAAPNLGLAITQLILGCLCVLLNIPQMILVSATGLVGIGIWGGIPMIIAGTFGIAATRNKGKCTVMTTMIMSIISSVMGGGVFANFAVGVAIDSEGIYVYDRYAKIAMGVCLMVFGMSELVIGIVQAVYCCKAMGMGSQIQPTVYHTACLPPNPQVLQSNQQIFAYVHGQMVPVGVMSQGVTMPVNQPHTGQQATATAYPAQFQYNLTGAAQAANTSAPAYTGPAALEANVDMAQVHNSKS